MKKLMCIDEVWTTFKEDDDVWPTYRGSRTNVNTAVAMYGHSVGKHSTNDGRAQTTVNFFGGHVNVLHDCENM